LLLFAIVIPAPKMVSALRILGGRHAAPDKRTLPAEPGGQRLVA
jgi:hypothetical protein